MKRSLAYLYSFVLALTISGLIFAPFSFSASTGVQIDFLLSQVRTASGSLSGGHVHFYSAGTTTNKAVYTDINKVSTAANPYTLDANGTALLYGDGTYRIVIHTSAGAAAFDRDNIKIEDLFTDLTNSGYTLTIQPKSVISNDTGNISGFDNITATTRVRAPNIGAAAGTDNGYFKNITLTGTPTFVDNTVNGANVIDSTLALGKLVASGTRDNTTFLRGDNTWSNIPQLAAYSNLKITTPDDNQSVTITADRVVVVDTSNMPRMLSTVSLTVNLDVAGANGLDNGSLAANIGYFLYVIDNGATTAGLASTSATVPTMPSGYTYKVLVGWCTTDNTATPFNIEEFTQVDDVYVWATKQKVVDSAGSTATAAINLAAGGSLSYAVIPPTITKGLFGKMMQNINAGYIYVNPVTFGNSASLDNSNTEIGVLMPQGGACQLSIQSLIESQTVYYQVSANTIDMWISGFTLKR